MMSFLRQIFPLSSIYVREDEHRNPNNTEWNLTTALGKFDARDCERIVIVGPDTADKTSLVFQAAVSAASVGVNVTHICTHPLKRLPMPVHAMPPPEPSIMNNVDFLYLEESSELITWFANVHTKSRLPALIIVEDVLTYASQLNDNMLERSLARLCATIADARAWIASKNGQEGCSVILTAPARALAMSHVLSQFSFKVAEYHGRSKDGSDSEMCFKEQKNTITVKFKRHKDSLMLTEVTASRTEEPNSRLH